MSSTDQRHSIAGGARSLCQRKTQAALSTGAKEERAERTGRSFPLGATVTDEGVNFSVFSRQVSRMELLLFDAADALYPARIIELDPRTHRTYHYWHAFVPGICPGQIYAYRADGPFDPQRGLRFDPAKVLLDPYGRAVVVPDEYSRHAASRYDVTKKVWLAEYFPEDDDGGELAPEGRVMEMLSEHTVEGWLEGYLLSGRHGLINSYCFSPIEKSKFVTDRNDPERGD